MAFGQIRPFAGNRNGFGALMPRPEAQALGR
jgi:hypothetical protein